MLLTRPQLLVAVALCAVLQLVARRTLPVHAAFPHLVAETRGDFTEGSGWYQGEPLVTATAVRAWGSWTGDDAHTGALALGPFPAPARLRFAAGGYPAKPGNALELELVETGARTPIRVATDIGERWRILDFDPPAAWRGRPVRLHARDDARDLGGWLAVSEPLRGGRGEGNHAFYDSLAALALNGLLLLLLGQAVLGGIHQRDWLAPHWQPLAAGAGIAAFAYLVFWCYFAHPLAGRIVSGGALALAVVHAWRAARRADTSLPVDVAEVLRLGATTGIFLLALLHLFPTSLSFDDLAGNRFRERMPTDNVLPYDLASRLYAGLSPKNPEAQWQSSDRPPLQTGWELLTWGATAAAGLDPRTASGTAAMWFQLLWVPAVYGLFRTLRLDPRRAAAWTAVLTLSGFFVQNTTFTWPKLASAALMLGAWAQWFASPAGHLRRRDFALGALFAALGWLAHGGLAFALLGLAPWVLRRVCRGEWRGWALAAGVFLLCALPWLAYQRYYEPPADQLVKWHLGGQTERDPRGTWETLRDGYGRLSWAEIRQHKLANFRVLFEGNWSALGDFSAEHAKGRRHDEFFLTARALTWWLGGLGLLGVVLLRRASRASLAATGRWQAGLAGWTAATVVVWCLLMFTGGSTVIHQGSYTVMLVLFVLLSVWLEYAGRGWLVVVGLLQTATLATTYTRPNEIVGGPPAGLPFVLLGGAALAWFVVRAFPPFLVFRSAPAGRSLPAPSSDLPAPLRRLNRLTWWLVLAIAVLLALRKPSALLTPQLWAEDGSIFLLQQESLGLAAFFEPYMGYLHTLPRIVAALAAHLVDPAWWPHGYNGAAFVIWVAVIARTFSRRLRLPHKPWLALAFIVGPQTGEILLNLTNVQWITAFVLLQQALIDRPENWRQRTGDLLLIAVVGLTGPFVIALGPLLAWRWWRDRHADNLAVLLVAAAAAGVQAWCVHRAAIAFDHQSAPFHLFNAATVLARRLFVWPIFGPHLAQNLPASLVATLGMGGMAFLFTRAFRPHPHRLLRLQLLAGFTLMLLAGFVRMRPDTWTGDDLVFSDRYFFVPRVLLCWLLLLEIDATERAIAWAARGAALAIALVHLPGFMLPAPPDYRWREHSAAIRRGEKADIPILPEGWTLHYPGRPGGQR